MKSLYNYITEKLIVNKNYNCNDSITKLLDELPNKEKITVYDGWGFASKDDGFKDIYDEIKQIIETESTKKLSCKTDPNDIKDMLRQGYVIVSFNYSRNNNPYISFIAQWERISMHPYFEINFVLFDDELRVNEFLQDRLLGHSYDSEVHYIVPKKIYLELLEYVHTNDNSTGSTYRAHDYDEIYNSLEKNLK